MRHRERVSAVEVETEYLKVWELGKGWWRINIHRGPLRLDHCISDLMTDYPGSCKGRNVRLPSQAIAEPSSTTKCDILSHPLSR